MYSATFWITFITFADEKCYTVTKKVCYMVIKRDRYLKQVIDSQDILIDTDCFWNVQKEARQELAFQVLASHLLIIGFCRLCLYGCLSGGETCDGYAEG